MPAQTRCMVIETHRSVADIDLPFMITRVRISPKVTYHPAAQPVASPTCGMDSFSRISTGVWCTDSPIAMMLLFCSIAYPEGSVTRVSQTNFCFGSVIELILSQQEYFNQPIASLTCMDRKEARYLWAILPRQPILRTSTSILRE